MFRHLQSVMDLRIVVEKLRHLGQHRFDLLVAGTCSSERHDAYSAAKLVADSVVQLVQQQLLLRRGQLGTKRRHNVHPAIFRWVFAAGDLACRPNCNWRKSVWKSIRRDRNPARQTKSHQTMWRARASTGLPPCHDLVAGGGEFLCPEELYGRATMRTKFLAMTAVVTSGVIATAFLVQSLSSSSAQTQARQLPEYTASGDLVLPKNFHEWIYVGSPLTPNALNGGEAGF